MLERFYNNICFICRSKGIKIGALEKEVGVSPGYFSRMRNGKGLSVVNAFYVAKALDSDLMEMLECDIGKQARIRELEKELSMVEKELARLKGEEK